MGMEVASDTLISADELKQFLRSHRPYAAILLITVIALLARLVFLGDRIAHFDEARVGYWAMHYLDSGEFHYRYIVHGPFLQHVDRWLFAVLDPNDFTMRLPVAIISGLLPASVLLYREHLRESELIGAAVFLAFNPIVLYYSRFFRSTLPTIAFAFVAFGLIVRAVDTRKPLYLHVAMAFVALSFATKENAIVYILVWLGAFGLLLDHMLFRPHDDRTGVGIIAEFFRNVQPQLDARIVGRLVGHTAIAALVFGFLILFFYAPRAGDTGGVGLWQAFAHPGQFSDVIDVTLHGSRSYPGQPGIIEGFQYWLGGGIESGHRHTSIIDRYLTFGGVALKAIAEYATPLIVLAIGGFVIERYASRRPRFVVLFAFYWGFVSLLGFPLGSDIASAWITVNGLVPLALPAGVGFAAVYRRSRRMVTDGVTITSIATAIVITLVVLSMSYGAATGVYTNDQSEDNTLVQYAQPADNLRPALRDMRQASATNAGIDVLFYGNGVVAGPKEETVNTVYPACSRMVNTLPLPWYLAIFDSNATCDVELNLSSIEQADRPPIVVTKTPFHHTIQAMFGDYEVRTYHFRALGGQTSIMIAPEYSDANTTK